MVVEKDGGTQKEGWRANLEAFGMLPTETRLTGEFLEQGLSGLGVNINPCRWSLIFEFFSLVL